MTQFGHAGVDLFFVLSGFIILFAHHGDIGRPKRLGRYIGRRLTRVIPLYWIALAVTLLIEAAGGHAAPAASDVIRSATLAPSFREPLLGVAWTLQYEAVFYAVFAILIVSRRAGRAALAVWMGLIAARALTGAWFAPSCLDGAYCVEFFLGMATAWRLRRGLRIPVRGCLGFGIALFAAAAVSEDLGWLDGYAPPARLAYGAPAALLIAALAKLDLERRLHTPTWLRTLGVASYSIYLFQFVFIGAVWKLWLAAGLDRAAPLPACYAALAAVAIGGGVAVRRGLERPLLQILRGRRGAP